MAPHAPHQALQCSADEALKVSGILTQPHGLDKRQTSCRDGGGPGHPPRGSSGSQHGSQPPACAIWMSWSQPSSAATEREGPWSLGLQTGHVGHVGRRIKEQSLTSVHGK